jgi:hypothetical protein
MKLVKDKLIVTRRPHGGWTVWLPPPGFGAQVWWPEPFNTFEDALYFVWNSLRWMWQ